MNIKTLLPTTYISEITIDDNGDYAEFENQAGVFFTVSVSNINYVFNIEGETLYADIRLADFTPIALCEFKLNISNKENNLPYDISKINDAKIIHLGETPSDIYNAIQMEFLGSNGDVDRMDEYRLQAEMQKHIEGFNQFINTYL
jgi:hypothetical protein